MLLVHSPVVVAERKIVFVYNFAALLPFLSKWSFSDLLNFGHLGWYGWKIFVGKKNHARLTFVFHSELKIIFDLMVTITAIIAIHKNEIN